MSTKALYSVLNIFLLFFQWFAHMYKTKLCQKCVAIWVVDVTIVLSSVALNQFCSHGIGNVWG